MAELPESNLTKKFKNQASELESNILSLNEILQLCSDSSLTEDQLLQKASPIIEKLSKSNPSVGKELKEVLTSGDHSKIKAFFDKDIQRRKQL